MAEKTKPFFFVYSPANFALRFSQKALAYPQSYDPTNLKRKMLPVLGR